MFFRWDPKKAASNRKKHGIDFHEAATVFLDDLSSAFPDPEHSETEDRFVTIGTSSKGRILIVVHVDGAQSIRIISARKATAHERRYYEEGGN